jgi:hypothetical protein
MKKWYEMIIKAIEVTKRYTSAEIKQLAWLFLYLNKLDIDDENSFWTWVSAKWLYKLLNPLTKTWKSQRFLDWWDSVSNTARLKENVDYEVREIIEIRNVDKQAKSAWTEISVQAKMWWNRGSIPVREIDYILTLRAWEYCAVLTKWDSWDLYRRFIFDIKDEFLRLVFRNWKSIETRNEFTMSIGNLDFMQKLKEENKRETISNIYWEMTNLIYLELFWVKAIEFKELNKIDKKYFAKDFFTKDWLFDLEKVENSLWIIIKFYKPKSLNELKKVIVEFLNQEVKIL